MPGRHVRATPASDDSSEGAATPGFDRRLILLGALIILAVAVIFAALNPFGSDDDSKNTAATSTATKTTKAAGKSSGKASATQATTGKPATSTAPTSVAPATTKPAATTQPAAPKTSTPTVGATTGGGVAQPPRVPLLVLNNSSVDNLGSAAAADFRAGGWTVADVGNLRGRIKDTTVYYNAGYEAQARALALQFPQIHRVLPRIPGLPGTGKVTVVITRYYTPVG